eukprot:jgi/Bigna1/68684/fgenesh1_pg.6_\
MLASITFFALCSLSVHTSAMVGHKKDSIELADRTTTPSENIQNLSRYEEVKNRALPLDRSEEVVVPAKIVSNHGALYEVQPKPAAERFSLMKVAAARGGGRNEGTPKGLHLDEILPHMVESRDTTLSEEVIVPGRKWGRDSSSMLYTPTTTTGRRRKKSANEYEEQEMENKDNTIVGYSSSNIRHAEEEGEVDIVTPSNKEIEVVDNAGAFGKVEVVPRAAREVLVMSSSIRGGQKRDIPSTSNFGGSITVSSSSSSSTVVKPKIEGKVSGPEIVSEQQNHVDSLAKPVEILHNDSLPNRGIVVHAKKRGQFRKMKRSYKTSSSSQPTLNSRRKINGAEDSSTTSDDSRRRRPLPGTYIDENKGENEEFYPATTVQQKDSVKRAPPAHSAFEYVVPATTSSGSSSSGKTCCPQIEPRCCIVAATPPECCAMTFPTTYPTSMPTIRTEMPSIRVPELSSSPTTSSPTTSSPSTSSPSTSPTTSSPMTTSPTYKPTSAAPTVSPTDLPTSKTIFGVSDDALVDVKDCQGC